MELKVKKVTKKKVITIELETVNFTEVEDQMLDQLGEPLIEIDKTYGNNPIKFSKLIRKNFKVRVKFDANLETDGTEQTVGYVDTFLEDVENKLSEEMAKLLDQYSEDLKTIEQTIPIEY